MRYVVDDSISYFFLSFTGSFFFQICAKISAGGWTVVEDPDDAQGPYAYRGNNWVSFDDTAIIRRKSELVRSMGMGGAMIWALDFDDFRNTCGCETYPLLKTINRVLRGYPSPSSVDCLIRGKNRVFCTVITLFFSNIFLGSGTSTTEVVEIEFPDSEEENEPSECIEGSFKSHEAECSNYYHCTSREWVLKSCPAGLYWDKVYPIFSFQTPFRILYRIYEVHVQKYLYWTKLFPGIVFIRIIIYLIFI